MMSAMGRAFCFLVVTVWMSALYAGLWTLWRYENTAGIAASPPAAWPSDSKIHLLPGRATLVLFAHPHCACTRASLGELALLLPHCRGKLSVYVLFYRPAEFPEGWERTDLWRSAAAIPGVHVVSDKDGAEAGRFHAATSGQALLYDTQGQVVFKGGITRSRGHFGDNAGRSAIVAFMTGASVEQTQTPVFGCSLLGTDVKRRKEPGKEAKRITIRDFSILE